MARTKIRYAPSAEGVQSAVHNTHVNAESGALNGASFHLAPPSVLSFNLSGRHVQVPVETAADFQDYVLH